MEDLLEPTVFAVDDDPGMREGLSVLLGSVGLKVETFASAPAFLETYDPARPGCLLLDIRMPGMNGLELQETLKARNAHLPIIVLTGHADVAAAVRAMRAGAMDFIEKPFREDELIARVRQAIDRDRRQAAERRQLRLWQERLGTLTTRESQVFRRIAAGRSTRQIAEEFGVTTQAIDAHRKKVLHKMGVATLAELVRIAVKLGLN